MGCQESIENHFKSTLKNSAILKARINTSVNQSLSLKQLMNHRRFSLISDKLIVNSSYISIDHNIAVLIMRNIEAKSTKTLQIQFVLFPL